MRISTFYRFIFHYDFNAVGNTFLLEIPIYYYSHTGYSLYE